MFRIRELVDANRKEIASLLTAEHGKVLSDAMGEVARGLDFLQGYVWGRSCVLGEPEGEGEAGHASILYFDVADLPATYAALRARGVTFKDAPHLIARMPDHELWMAFFADSEGNTLALMSEVRPAAA